VEIFRKPYLSHPDSELDVLYMDLDLLDETYPMGKSKLPFKDFDQGGLTEVHQTYLFFVSTRINLNRRIRTYKSFLLHTSHFPLVVQG
jgi:hypothetical protein